MALVTLPLPLSLFPPFSTSLSLLLVFLGPCMASNKVYTHGTTTDNVIHSVPLAFIHTLLLCLVIKLHKMKFPPVMYP